MFKNALNQMINLVSIVFLYSSQIALAEETNSDKMHAVADVLRAEADYMKALGEAQLNFAKSQVELAKAAAEWQRVRQWTLLVNRLQLQLARAAKDEHKLRQSIANIEKRLVTVRTILTGQVSRYSISALKYLAIHAFEAETVAEVMTAPTPDFGADEFVGTLDVKPFGGENVGQLIEYLRVNDVNVQPWGKAHQAIVGAIVELVSGAEVRLQKINNDMDALNDSINPFELK